MNKAIIIVLYYWVYNTNKYNTYDKSSTKEEGRKGPTLEQQLLYFTTLSQKNLKSTGVRCVL